MRPQRVGYFQSWLQWEVQLGRHLANQAQQEEPGDWRVSAKRGKGPQGKGPHQTSQGWRFLR